MGNWINEWLIVSAQSAKTVSETNMLQKCITDSLEITSKCLNIKSLSSSRQWKTLLVFVKPKLKPDRQVIKRGGVKWKQANHSYPHFLFLLNFQEVSIHSIYTLSRYWVGQRKALHCLIPKYSLLIYNEQSGNTIDLPSINQCDNELSSCYDLIPSFMEDISVFSVKFTTNEETGTRKITTLSCCK